MEEPVLIRALDNSYCQRIIDLILPIQQIEFGVPITIEAQPDLLDIEGCYIRPGGGFWGALTAQGPFGPNPTNPNPTNLNPTNPDLILGSIALMSVGHNAGVIRKMFVRKEFRGKQLSIAQRLLDTLITHCRNHGIHDIYLGTVDQMKAAHRFYERNGFRAIGIDALPSYFPRMKTDNLFYHLHLEI
ncbi:GNAT family N-acetyltransferase [Puia sp. P3]|uniref:GNAT family N-acetyltransferase n=1 Tax=Puia sp. P3 TaxID=3423952 RepID=UPI003D67C5AC